MASESNRRMRTVAARPEVSSGLSLASRQRRSYEAEDLISLLQEKNNQECAEQIKEKDLVIAELQNQLKSLRKTIPAGKRPAIVKPKDQLVGSGSTLLSGQKSFRMKASTRGGFASQSSVRSKVPTIDDSKRDQVEDKKTLSVSHETDANEDQVRRLTEELAKQQAEYARLRTVLQATNLAGPATSPTPFQVPSYQIHSEFPINANGHANGEPECTEKASFRREILRLKEELLAAQQKMIAHLEGKSVVVEELRHLKEDHVKRETDLMRVIADRETTESKLQLEVADLRQLLGEADESKRSLRKRLKESEKEAVEMKEFLREEHESLSEAFKEAEARLAKHMAAETQLTEALKVKEDVCDVLTKVADSAQARIRILEAELKDTEDGARDLLLKQGVELNSCAEVVQQIYQLLDIGTSTATGSSGLVAAILEAEFAGNVDAQSAQLEEGLASKIKVIERAIKVTSNRVNTLITSLDKVEMERRVLESDLRTAVNRTKELECEMVANAVERERLIEENHRLRTAFDESQQKLKESWHTVSGRIDANQRADDLQTKLDRESRLLRTVRADNAEIEKQLNSALAGDRRVQDESTLKRKIEGLRQEVLDKQDEMEAAQKKHDCRCRILKDNFSKAEVEIRRLNAVVDHVLMCLKSVSSVVETDEKLKQLWQDLNGEQSTANGDRVRATKPD